MEAALWGRLNNVKDIREVQTSAMLWPSFILTARPGQCPQESGLACGGRPEV
jgi:hypothetical protein